MADVEAGKGRLVGGFQLLALGVNGIVGVGIFFTPAAVAANAPGRTLIVVFALTGLALLPTAMAFATLGRRFDEDGGPVVFARAAFGDTASFFVGWITYVSAFLSAAAVVTGLATALMNAWGIRDDVAVRGLSLLLATVLTLVVASGIRVSAWAWTGLTVAKLLPLLALVGAWALFAHPAMVAAPAPAQASWLRAALTVLFAYQGFEIVPVIAGQVRSVSRAVPFATIGSLLLAILLYTGLVTAAVDTVPQLASSPAPLAAAGGALGGAFLGGLVSWGTSLSSLGIAFGMLVTTPRYLSALASGSRTLLGFDRFGARGVPMRAVAVTWGLVAAMVLLGDLSELFALSSAAVLAQYGVTAASLAVLAARRERGLRPLDAWPALPTLVLAIGLVAFGATGRELGVAAIVVVVGLGLHQLARPREKSAA
jgi:APA family basic amino acid/polyamine antiporter